MELGLAGSLLQSPPVAHLAGALVGIGVDSWVGVLGWGLGAGPWAQFRHALWPQLAPGVLASLVTCFSLSLDDFLITFFVKGFDQMTLPVQIFSMLRLRVAPEVYSLSFLLFCISTTVVLLSQLWLNSDKKSLRKKTFVTPAA